MIGLICVYFIGKYFYKLAQLYKQPKLIFTFVGIASFYFGSIVLGNILISLFLRGSIFFGIELARNFRISIFTMPFGIVLSCFIHFLLEKKWKKSQVNFKDEIEDIGKLLK